MISQGCIAFTCNFMQTNQGPDRLCQVKAMFKQHENLMIWTWIFAASNSFAKRIPMEEFASNNNFNTEPVLTKLHRNVPYKNS